MPSPEERKIAHLANIGTYMRDLVKVMTAVNQNLVEIGKIMKEPDKQEVEFATGDRLYKIPEEKTLTLSDWMDELKRWWNYSVVGGADETQWTKEEFFQYMSEHGTEMTAQVRRDRPDLFDDQSLDKKLSCGCTVRDHKFGEHLEGE